MKRGDGLSERELQVVDLLVQGKSHVQIGMALGLSEYTIHTHVSRAISKLGVPNSVALAVKVTKMKMGGRDDDNS
jgi:DNA-binding NarL/FixJ family response regulator